MERNAISLFSSSGIGDLGMHANGINTVVARYLIKKRMDLFQNNNPGTPCFCGDIWKLEDEIVDFYRSKYEHHFTSFLIKKVSYRTF